MEKFIIAVNIEELLHVLQQKGFAKGYGYPISLPVPAGTTLVLDFPIRSGWLGAPIEIRMAPDPDHALSLVAYKDGELYYEDDDLVAGIYSIPVKYFKDYNLLRFARDKFTIVITNNTTDTAYFNAIFVWAEIREKAWRNIVERYYDVIVDAFGLKE